MRRDGDGRHENQSAQVCNGGYKECVGALGGEAAQKVARAPCKHCGQGIAGGQELGRRQHFVWGMFELNTGARRDVRHYSWLVGYFESTRHLAKPR